ncbi:hypothetical protein BHE74_00039003 [Ensete ventricosum]|nr:hypothetical protein BHE74_00039003 [Ensete ventricosum]
MESAEAAAGAFIGEAPREIGRAGAAKAASGRVDTGRDTMGPAVASGFGHRPDTRAPAWTSLRPAPVAVHLDTGTRVAPARARAGGARQQPPAGERGNPAPPPGSRGTMSGVCPDRDRDRGCFSLQDVSSF